MSNYGRPSTVTDPAKERVDVALTQRGLVRSRSHARQLLARGLVSVDGVVVTRAAEQVTGSSVISVHDEVAAHEVSRAGGKLRGALEEWGLAVPERCVDVGSSTGGFTQVLLDRGASTVFAVDVGTDQLAPSLRADPRVHVREQTNARFLTVDQLDGEPVDLAVADVSFISLTLLVEPIFGVLSTAGEALLMVKPQFEVGREHIGHGVVSDAELRERAVRRVRDAALAQGWTCVGTVPSSVPGPAGNLEYFCRFVRR